MKRNSEIKRYIHENFNFIQDKLVEMKNGTMLKSLRKKYKYICIFGYGHLGVSTYKRLQVHGVKVDYFCDNNPNANGGQCFTGESIESERISFEQLCRIKDDCLVFVSPSNGQVLNNNVINKQLKDVGFRYIIYDSIWLCISMLFWDLDKLEKNYFADKVEELIELADDEESVRVIEAVIHRGLHDWYDFALPNPFDPLYNCVQYFPEFITPYAEEYFVDGGAFTGDTFDVFYRWCGGRFGHYYGFEIDKHNFEELCNHINSFPALQDRFSLFPYGIYERSEKVKMTSVGNFGVISESGNDVMDVVTLDTCLKDNVISFIKMDVEDSEIPALRGAKEIISTQKPLCAISMYHSLQQFLEIPGLLKKLNPGYTMRYRMHTTVAQDIVCYAIDENDKEHRR